MKSQQKLIEETLALITQKGYENHENDFLKALAAFLVDLLKVDYVLINKYELQIPKVTETVVICSKKGFLPNISYDLVSTPCENVINQNICTYSNNLQTLFPKDELLAKMKVNSYCGIPLWSSIGDPIGLIAILDGAQIIKSKTVEIILQIAAVKAAHILEKILYENKLKLQINHLKASKDKIQESEEKFKNLANLTLEGILISDNGIAIDINQAFLKMFGYNQKELLGKNVKTLIFSEKYHKMITENRLKGSTQVYEIEGIRKDGSVFPVEIEARNIKSKTNKTLRVASFRDLTQHKKSQTESKKLYTAVEQSANTIVITNTLGNIEYINPKFTEITGYTAKEVLGQNPRVLNSGNQPKEYYAEMWKTISVGKIWKGEFLNKSKNGKLFWEQVTITPIKNEAGEIINYLAIKEDITKRKKSENSLKVAFEIIKENEDYLSNILKTANEGFWTINTKAITKEVNPVMCNILGYKEDEIIGKPIFEFVDEKNEKIFKKQLKDKDSGLSSVYEIKLKKSTGKNVPCLFKTSPIYDTKNVRIGSFALVTDISHLKKTHKKLENKNSELTNLSDELSKKNKLYLESNYRFKSLFEHSPISLWEEDYSEPKKLLIKKQAEVKDLKKYLDENPNFVDKCVSKIKIISVNQNTLELFKVKDKEALITQLRKTDNDTSREVLKKELLSVVSDTNEFRTVAEFIRSDGLAITTILKLAKIDNEGKVIVSLTNITALKNTEKELIIAKEKAEESDRLKTEFLNNMSHEIRTPMNGILGFSQLLSEPNLDAEKRKNFVNIVQNSGKQLLHIIDDILEISSLGAKQVKVVDEEVCLNDVFLELFSIFDIKAKENKTPLYLKKVLSDQQSTVITDKTKLNKIISNLLENALKFTNNGFIEFGYSLKSNEELQELEIYVKDTGIGIKPEKHEQIFESFSQAEKDLTKKVGGLGLGLSIAKENTELLGGKITLESEMMEGSTFFVTIPFKPVYPNAEPENAKTKCSILIAEDEEVNYMYLETILKNTMKLNCDIFHAKNGKEAVEICKENPNIDFILMDLKMPVLNGFKATKQIKEFRPKLPIIAQTAYSTVEDKKEAKEAGCNDFISKPINKEVLSEVIYKHLKETKNGLKSTTFSSKF